MKEWDELTEQEQREQLEIVDEILQEILVEENKISA